MPMRGSLRGCPGAKGKRICNFAGTFGTSHEHILRTEVKTPLSGCRGPWATSPCQTWRQGRGLHRPKFCFHERPPGRSGRPTNLNPNRLRVTSCSGSQTLETRAMFTPISLMLLTVTFIGSKRPHAQAGADPVPPAVRVQRPQDEGQGPRSRAQTEVRAGGVGPYPGWSVCGYSHSPARIPPADCRSPACRRPNCRSSRSCWSFTGKPVDSDSQDQLAPQGF